MRKELKNYVLSLGIEKSIQSKFMKLLMLMVSVPVLSCIMIVQPLPVAGHRICPQHIFQQGALLADLQLAVAVGALEIQVQIDDEVADCTVIKLEFFTQDQQAAGPEPLIDALEQG